MAQREIRRLRIAIAGSGFGGIGLAYWLKKAGIENFTIYERSSELGGVWRDNHYPGAACDVPSRFYSYSFEQDYRWSAPYGGQAEILQYLNHCAEKYGAVDHIRFGAEIAAAMRERGIRIATWGEPDFEDFIRVSIGLPEDTEAFLAALGEILNGAG